MKFELKAEDCVAAMRLMKDESLDVAVTSPPYNNGTKYGVYKDNLPWPLYDNWSKIWMNEVRRVMKPGGSFFLNVANHAKRPNFAFAMLDLALQTGWKLQNTIIWVKSISVRSGDEVKSFGHFTPINSERFLNNLHEHVFHLTREGDSKLDRLSIGVPYEDKSNIERWNKNEGGKDVRCQGNVWYIPYKTIDNSALDRHPAPFPPQLAYQCIKLHDGNGLTVMDPFIGEGNTALAAWRCGPEKVSVCHGMDLDPKYIEKAKTLLTIHSEAKVK